MEQNFGLRSVGGASRRHKPYRGGKRCYRGDDRAALPPSASAPSQASLRPGVLPLLYPVWFRLGRLRGYIHRCPQRAHEIRWDRPRCRGTRLSHRGSRLGDVKRGQSQLEKDVVINFNGSGFSLRLSKHEPPIFLSTNMVRCIA